MMKMTISPLRHPRPRPTAERGHVPLFPRADSSFSRNCFKPKNRRARDRSRGNRIVGQIEVDVDHGLCRRTTQSFTIPLCIDERRSVLMMASPRLLVQQPLRAFSTSLAAASRVASATAAPAPIPPSCSNQACEASSSTIPHLKLRDDRRLRRRSSAPAIASSGGHRNTSSSSSATPFGSQQQRRGFHSSRPLGANSKDPYQVLGVKKDASASDIKKSYYQVRAAFDALHCSLES